MSVNLPEIGTADFWKLYDKFCTAREFVRLANGEQSQLCTDLQRILRKNPVTLGRLTITSLARGSRGWENPKAWLVLRNESVITESGHIFLKLSPCDVMTCEYGWDRDVFVTHHPIVERVSGQFLGQRWPLAEGGLFLPLYDKRTIMSAIKTRLIKNTSESISKAEEEARDWSWY